MTQASGRDVAWLIERPQTPDLNATWWHPKHGWTRDANRAIRYARKQDADDAIMEGRGFTRDVVATEHIFVIAGGAAP